MAVTLNHRLYARDVRAARQQELAAKFPGHSIIVLTAEIPGAVRNTRQNNDIGYEALRVLIERFGYRPDWLEVHELPTGFESFLVVPNDGADAKAICCDIEREHPLGRLFKLEVYGHDGKLVERRIKVDGYRPCLICGEDERTCQRMKAHTPAELDEAVDRLHNEFFHRMQLN
ncbi:MAG: citrate lyase holo-[acyl-carrier protein] synthase [Muribaculaceae bacterium]|nr:citrate lyase holo-[acyl-carrier protein] synthase [Muribaculaceae bacterium]